MFGLPALAWKAIGLAVVALTILGCGIRIARIWDAGTINKLQGAAHVAQAQAKASHNAQVIITHADQKAEVIAQADIKRQATVIRKKVHVHVTPVQDARACVTWGTLRVLDAAVDGSDPGDLGSPVAQPDDACSPVAQSVLVGGIADNYAAARANAEQLDALEADIAARGSAITGSPVVEEAPAPVPLGTPAGPTGATP